MELGICLWVGLLDSVNEEDGVITQRVDAANVYVDWREVLQYFLGSSQW